MPPGGQVMALFSTYQSTDLPLLSTLYEPPPKHLISVLGGQVSHDIRRIVRLKRAVMAPLHIDQERQHLPQRQGRLARPVALARAQQTAVIDRRQGLAAIVHIAEDS